MVKNTRQKGRAFTLKCIDKIKDIDPAAYEVSGSGAGRDKGDCRMPRFDLVIECKDHKQACVASWVGQADSQGLGYSKTALFWKYPKSPSANPEVRVDISLDFFKDLLVRSGEPKIKQPDRELRWELARLLTAAKNVIRKIE